MSISPIVATWTCPGHTLRVPLLPILYKNTIHTLQTTYLELCTSHYDYTVSIIKRLPNLYLATGYEPGDAHSTVPNLGATVLQVVLALQRALAQQHSLEQTPHKSCAS